MGRDNPDSKVLVSLREAREQKGLSAAEAAKIAGVCTSMIYAYERMHATPKPRIKKKLADLYGYKISDLAFKEKTYRKRNEVVEK